MALPLSSSIPSVQSCTIPQLLAFPTSLAALNAPLLWNASCWVADRRLDDFEQPQISQHQGKQHIEWCHFASNPDLTVSLLVVFPNLPRGFREDAVMQKWTDEVVLPAFRNVGVGAGVLSQSWRVIKLTAEAEREETLNVNAPDTPLREVLSKNGGISQIDVERVWEGIMESANDIAFEGFRGCFLVAICHLDGASLREMSIEKSWRTLTSVWDKSVDMKFVPLDTVRAHAKVTLGTQLSNTLPFVPSDMSMHGQTAPPIAPVELSRKRKVDNQDDNGKRSRFEEHSTRPWPTSMHQRTFMGRSYTTPMAASEDTSGENQADQDSTDTAMEL